MISYLKWISKDYIGRLIIKIYIIISIDMKLIDLIQIEWIIDIDDHIVLNI